jgi:hypothetical protein
MAHSVAQSRCFLSTALGLAGLLLIVAVSGATVAHAAAIRIVALGASNTNGKELGRDGVAGGPRTHAAGERL